MNEYQDQDTWFELYGKDPFEWVFIEDFDTREEAEEHLSQNAWIHEAYIETRIKRVRGIGD